MLPPECQFLGEDHRAEGDVGVVRTLVETLVLVCERGGRKGRGLVWRVGAYAVVRECHLRWEDEGVRAGCERVVDLIMGEEVEGGSGMGMLGEAGAGGVADGRVGGGGGMVTDAVGVEEVEDEEDEIVPIF